MKKIGACGKTGKNPEIRVKRVCVNEFQLYFLRTVLEVLRVRNVKYKRTDAPSLWHQQ